MPDLVPLIDAIGEEQTLALGAFVLAFIFGALAQRSGFCTRSAVLELTDRKPGSALATWLAAFGAAILLVQGVIMSGLVFAGESRFFATAQSLSGPLLGGAMFGIGMALARGCTSRLMVLGAVGNLRALTAIGVMALVAYATTGGFLAPAREAIAGLVSTNAIGGNDLTAIIGAGTALGMTIGGGILLFALLLTLTQNVSKLKLAAGALIGAVIAGGWIFTSALSTQVFEPIGVESLSFIRPSTSVVEQFSTEAGTFFTFDIGIITGIFSGAFLAALVFGNFRIERFSDAGAPHFLRYVLGGALMGFGGIVAVGCTVGAGFTGGSVLAISSLLGLVSMMIAGAITDLALRNAGKTAALPYGVPAE